VGDRGERVPFLHPVEAIGVNGLHAIVVAPVLVRIDMVPKGRTYEVLVTRHSVAGPANGFRAALETTILFRGVHGRIELDLWGQDKMESGSILPTFYSLAGEPTPIPKRLTEALKAVVKAVNCLNCIHWHYLVKPMAAARPPAAQSTTTVATEQEGKPRLESAAEGTVQESPDRVVH
jgi:hypothetical protein